MSATVNRECSAGEKFCAFMNDVTIAKVLYQGNGAI